MNIVSDVITNGFAVTIVHTDSPNTKLIKLSQLPNLFYTISKYVATRGHN